MRELNGRKWEERSFYDEVVLEEKNANPAEGSVERLEEAYRNMRAALEDNRSYAAAADFYVGEMEANRKLQKGAARYFSVAALYRLLSFYGTSVPRAVAWVLGFWVAHA